LIVSTGGVSVSRCAAGLCGRQFIYAASTALDALHAIVLLALEELDAAIAGATAAPDGPATMAESGEDELPPV